MIFTPVATLAERLRRRELSPVELAETCLDRLERLGPAYNAVVTLTRERARAAALEAEREIARGAWRGPLHGIPYGAKDLLATAGGVPTTWGAAPLRAQTFAADADAIRRMDAAGAVLVAKLAMVELAGGMGYRQPDAAFTGPGINPWNTAHWSGGSSSGPGSAVAAGLVPVALGSETWGSILGPSALSGITGLRPTHGRVSTEGAMVLSWSLDKIGPMALTVGDCGLVLEALAGPRTFRYRPAADRHLRIGVVREAVAAADDAVQAAFTAARTHLEAIGRVTDVSLPDLPAESAARIVLAAEAASAFEDFVERGQLAGLTAPEDRYTAYAREAVLARDYVRALRVRGLLVRALDRLFDEVDVLVGPGRPTLAPRLGTEFRSALRGTAGDPLGAAGNLAGLPAVAVPSGLGAGALPASVAFVARAWDEQTALDAARAFEARVDWHPRPPGL